MVAAAVQFDRPIVCPVLIGRAPHLETLDRALNRVVSGSGQIVLMAGEPGIGKTRLLQAATQHAVARGWSVLVGGCVRRDRQEPYAPVLGALAQHLHAAGPARVREALSGCAWLARLLPELAEVLEECDVPLLLPVLAWAYLELGQTDEAARTVEQALARARPEGMRLVLVEALRVRAVIALRRGQPDQTAASLEEGLETARAMPYPHAESRLMPIAERLRRAQVR
jgi:tetratricopeptide (TPR) repeat protein